MSEETLAKVREKNKESHKKSRGSQTFEEKNRINIESKERMQNRRINQTLEDKNRSKSKIKRECRIQEKIKQK